MYRAPSTWCKRHGAGYITTRPISWDIGKQGSDFTLIIEPGFEFESSVPWALRWILNPHDPLYLLAACVHDHLLEAGFRPFFAAAEWYDAALSAKAPRLKSLSAALGVVLVTIAKRWR